MSNVPLKDLKYSRFYVGSVYCSWTFFSDLNQNGCEIVRATVTPEIAKRRPDIPLPKISIIAIAFDLATA